MLYFMPNHKPAENYDMIKMRKIFSFFPISMRKSCRQCQNSFEIVEDDLKFYEKVSPVFNGKKYLIPPPTLCPDCRFQRRAARRNERHLYKRKCSFSGQDIVALYPENAIFPVYSQKIWWGDKWSPQNYGMDFDFNRPFFEQFSDLQNRVPRLPLLSKNSENSEYTNHATDNRNCYMSSIIFRCEDVFYSRKSFTSKSVIDSAYIFNHSELLYECFWGENLYNCKFSAFCSNSSDLLCCYDCRGCNNCFMSSNLRNKSYIFRNQQLTKDQYLVEMKKVSTGSRKKLHEILVDFKQLRLRAIQPALRNEDCEDVVGDFLLHCKDVYECYSSCGGESCRYCIEFDASSISSHSKDCMDSFGFGGSELLYEVHAQANGHNNKFCNWSYDVSDSCYLDMCHNVANCFGCVGLHAHEKYHILNKPYTPEKYEKMVARIIQHMQKTRSTGSEQAVRAPLSGASAQASEIGSRGSQLNEAELTNKEWGEFFPIQISPFPYNKTFAQEYFPLTKEQALKRGYQWEDSNQKDYKPQTFQVPDNIEDVPESILRGLLACSDCKKNFKIIRQELQFYRKMNLAIPGKCPDCRYKIRMSLVNPYKLWSRACAKCQAPIQTTYAPDQPEIVYCEKCYLEAVY